MNLIKGVDYFVNFLDKIFIALFRVEIVYVF